MKHAISAIGLALIVLAPVAPAAAQDCAKIEVRPLPVSPLVIRTDQGEQHFQVEVAAATSERAIGLMCRLGLLPGTGMLFDFASPRPAAFGMRNTLIPLDIIFIGEGGVIESIHAEAKPLDETPIGSTGPVRFVLELAGGSATRLGIKPGDRVEHSRIPN
ncbi:MAG: DUF192 domain-containing protein [Proteobacteria bacterium]|nr:DUF192 domain-containing protein [Pseudomonadota bacterium]